MNNNYSSSKLENIKFRFLFFYKNNNKTKEVYQILKNNQWNNELETNFIYENNNLIKKIKYLCKNKIKIINETIYKYNSFDKLENEIITINDSDIYKDLLTSSINFDIIYKYDDQHRIILEETKNCNKLLYFYDTDSNLNEYINYKFKNNDWIPTIKSINFFNNQNNIVKHQEFIIKNNKWKEYTKIIYEYDKDNNCIEELLYDFRDDKWFLYIKINNKFNKFNKIIEEKVQVYNNTIFITEFKYDNNSNLKQIIKETGTFSYKYDKNNNLIEYLEEFHSE